MTLLNGYDETSDSEIEVIDPRHPLFGRRFLLVSRTSSPHGPGHAFVAYREGMLLCIPLACTTLAPSRSPVCTKLTFDAVKELLSVAEDCEALCPRLPPLSGSACPPPCNSASSTSSSQSCRR